MSLVIAIKDKGRVVLGADKQCTWGDRKEHCATKVWVVPGYDKCIMGGVGFTRANQIMQYCEGLLDKNNFNEVEGIDEKFIVTQLVPTIYNVLLSYELTTKIEDSGTQLKGIPNVFLFAYKDRVFSISQDLSVTEIDDYIAIGSGADIAKGVLITTPDVNPFERIATAIRAASQETLYVDDFIEYASTDILPSDKNDALVALGSDYIIDDETESTIEAEAKKETFNKTIDVKERKKKLKK